MSIEAIPVWSVGELIAKVVQLTGEQGEHWSPAWFRGQENASWNLEPGVPRNVRRLEITNAAAYEKNLTHRFRARAPLYGPAIPYENHGAWLQTMQHHRLPTRLLDWTRSPLMAAYFAVKNFLEAAKNTTLIRKPCAEEPPDSKPCAEEPPDAAVWALFPHGLNYAATYGAVTYTPGIESNTARALIDGAFFGDESARRDAHVRQREWHSKLADAPGSFREESTRIEPDCLAVMASESDLRMLVQQGAFTVHSADSCPLDTDPRYAPWIRKYVIKAGNCGRLLSTFAREVEACGFSEATLFPDLDSLSSELQRTQQGVGARR